MAQKLTKVAETTTLANTDTLIVVDESAQNTDGSTGALKRIPKSSTGFALPSDITSAINTEVSNRNTAISNAIDTEVDNRNNAIDEAVSTKADAIVKTASGEVASFTDGGNGLLVKSLKVSIVPKQSGSGDPSPSNVRPISGYEGVNVTRRGKNLLKNTATTQTYAGITYTINADGTITANGTATNRSYCVIWFDYDYFSNYFKDGTYILSGCPSGGANFTYALDLQAYGNGNVYDIGEGATINTANLTNQTYRFVIDIKAGTTMNNAVFKPMLRLANTSAEYEPYQGTSYPISLGQTVYGGTLDVVSGKLTIDKAMVLLGSLSWTTKTDSIGQYFKVNLVPSNMAHPTSSGVNANAVCERYVISNSSNVFDGSLAIGWTTSQYASVSMYCRDTTCLTLSDFQTAIANTKLVYELKTPTEITLTPTQVKTLLGNNNIWANSGSVEVEYRADTTLAYNKLLSIIASLS